MKKLLLILTIVLDLTVAHGQTSNWFWAKTAGGNFDDIGNSICTDNKGNVFVTGYFNSSNLTFGSTTLNNYDSNYGDLHYDMFLAKYDSVGNLLWAKSAGGGMEDHAYSVCTDSSGNAFVTGSFSSPAMVFGSDTLINNSLGYGNIFLVKYDASGNVLWAKSVSGNSGNYTNSVSTDNNGNAFITGGYTGTTITFDSITLINNASSGNSNIFLAKYDASGNILWAKSFGGSGGTYGGDNGKSIGTDGNGNVFITGGFYSHTIVFGSDTLTNIDTLYTNADIFIAKFDASGNVLWVKREGGTDVDEGNSIKVDANGNVFVTGYFYSHTITFGNLTFVNNTVSGFNTFLVKYDSTGNVLWAKSTDGYFKSTSTDKHDNIFVTGSFGGSIVFGSDTLTNTGSSDIFLTKYDSSGNVYWAKTVTEYGSGFNSCNSVSTDESGNAFITGSFSSDHITFDSTFNNAGGGPCGGGCSDVFVAKFCNSNAFIKGNTTLCTGQNTTLTITTPGTNYLWNTGDTTASIIVSPTTTTTYSVTTSIGTFTATATTIVTVNSNPPPTAEYNLVHDGYSIILSDASISAPGDTINRWDWQLPGADYYSSNSQNPVTICYLAIGNYTICLTAISSKGCSDQICDAVNITNTCPITSVNELESLSSINVSPNPFTTFTTIHSNTPFHNATLNLYNCIGQTVKQIKNISGQTIILNRDNLPSGLYFICITQDTKTLMTEKLVITDN